MADNSEYFTVGSSVWCKTCLDQEFEGEVLAFDPHSKMLILKCPATNNRPSLQDINIVNLSLVSDLKVKKETTGEPQPLQNLNCQRINNRLKQSIEEKKRLITAKAQGVSPEGQNLFLTITKTIDEVTWQGQNIVVMNDVTILPPYKPENVRGNAETKKFIHVKKIVEKYVKDQALGNSSSNTNSSL